MFKGVQPKAAPLRFMFPNKTLAKKALCVILEK